jgi:DNA-binding NtrC family response regulator
MQSAYRRLVQLAATDLPICLAGEKGTELEWGARLIHRLRGLDSKDFRVWDSKMTSGETSDWWLDAADERDGSPPVTLLARCLDEASERMQRKLYDHLVQGLGRPRPVRVIVTERLSAGGDGSPSRIYPDLYAFLAATRLEIPPLRARIVDLEGLVSHFARSRALDDPVDRFTPDAMEVLRSYHWPGNVEELNVIVDYIVQNRPAGSIRVEDLPETIRAPLGDIGELVRLLEGIYEEEGFRALQSTVGRHAMAHFLAQPAGESFSLLELQKRFDVGRETARRLLAAFTARGLVRGEKGAKGERITRYRRADRE